MYKHQLSHEDICTLQLNKRYVMFGMKDFSDVNGVVENVASRNW